jgi:hypothetical protein
MDYAQTYFGKPLAELQFTDIEHFFLKERQESDQIEFKSYNTNGQPEAKLVKVIEGITAFLNSSGGLLIWGAPEGINVVNRKEKAFVGSLTKLPLTIEKDWLISKIADKIIPLPRGFRVQLVPTSDGQVAVFEIDESPYSPHQTGNTYYMRIDGASKPAPHHYIEALFKKISFPKLEAHIKIGQIRTVKPFVYAVEVTFFFFNFSPYLNEEKLLFTIETYRAHFQQRPASFGASAPLPDYYKHGKLCRSSLSSDSALAYGFPFVVTQELIFQETELVATGGLESITIIFSGKAAPAKFCRYHLRIDPSRTQVSCNIGSQNRLLSDINDEMGRTDEKLLAELAVLLPKPSDNTWFLED